MSATPTGRVVRLGDSLTLQVERTFHAPIEDVWAAITEPERLARWLGTWRGDPTEGSVLFRMLFEGEDAAEDEMKIRECRPPRRLAVTSQVGDEWWDFDLDLTEQGGVTTVVFGQPNIDREGVPGIGAGWEYYFDRLVAVETGGDLGAIDFERDYYPAMEEYYQAQLDDAGGG
jgi:uncharacterized protein YndB with AHSA1/START domain